MDVRAAEMLDRVAGQLTRLLPLLDGPVPAVEHQPVIRDVWHDHLLFDEDEVSGIVDFGAMAVDTVAVDIARLLGSLVGGDSEGWSVGLAAYTEVRPLSSAERQLLGILDHTGLFAGGLVWLRWHYLEERWFENRAGVLARVDHFLNRLRTTVPALSGSVAAS